MTLTKKQPMLYPGMKSSGVEFFVFEDEMNFIANGEIKPILNAPFSILQLTKEEILKNSEVDAALKIMHPTSELKRLIQFLECRYGGLDYNPDIKDNQFGEPDYWDCPKRPNCEFNGLICKAPKYKGSELTLLDIKLTKLLVTSATNETIADMLNLAFGSFHKHKQSLYAKFGGIQTKQELALIAKSLNLI
jgi:DNA-binding CsgD family transcriptional regulator